MLTFFSRLLLEAHFHGPVRGQASEAAGSPAPWSDVFQAVCSPWMEESETGKTCLAVSPGPSSTHSLLRPVCPSAKQSIQMGSVSSGHTGPRCRPITSS